MAVYVESGAPAGFGSSRAWFEEIVGWLDGADSGGLTHAELEEQLTVRGRELLRQLQQDHLDLRAVREERLAVVVGDDAVARRHAEPGHVRGLATGSGR